MLVARVVHDEVGDDPDSARMGLRDQFLELRQRAELGQNRGVVGDVIAAVAQRGRGERRQPQAIDTEPLQVIQLGDDALEIAGPGPGRVAEGAHEHLIKDGLPEPVGIGFEPGGARAVGHQFFLTAMMWTGSPSGPRRT